MRLQPQPSNNQKLLRKQNHQETSVTETKYSSRISGDQVVLFNVSLARMGSRIIKNAFTCCGHDANIPCEPRRSKSRGCAVGG